MANIISAANAYRQSKANDIGTRVSDWWTTASNVVATAINEAVAAGQQHAYAKLSYSAYADIDREEFQKFVKDELETDSTTTSYKVDTDVPGPLETDKWFIIRIGYEKDPDTASAGGSASGGSSTSTPDQHPEP